MLLLEQCSDVMIISGTKDKERIPEDKQDIEFQCLINIFLLIFKSTIHNGLNLFYTDNLSVT